MMDRLFIKLGLRLVLVCALALAGTMAIRIPAPAFEESALLLSFNPEEGFSTRYMFQLIMTGIHVSPGFKDEMIFGEFMIGTVYKDEVVEALSGLNRHEITFYSYNVRSLQTPFGRDRADPRFGGNPWPVLPGGGDDDGGGDGGGGNGSMGGFLPGLDLPNGFQPMQGGGGGGGSPGGGLAGGNLNQTINLDSILITNLEYVTNKQGELLDIGGLDLLRKVSQNRLMDNKDDKKYYIDINISHVFEWTHLLYLPTYPVYKEDLWFHSYPIHVPGLPADQPIMTKFMYKLVDYRTIGTRKVAVIDAMGICEWNLEWETTTAKELTEFKSWGNMGIATRYWFDYENGEIFGIERPPFVDWQYQRQYGALELEFDYEDRMFTMRYPGLIISMEFFYNTRTTDVSGKPRLVEVEPEEQRRYIALNIICQLEAE